MGAVEERLEELGIELPPLVVPTANFQLTVQTGSLVYISGHAPIGPDGTLAYQGAVGSDLSVEEGAHAARLTMINALRSLQQELGTLDRVVRFVKLLGMVRCGPDFTEQSKVIDGASDVLVEIFGDRGRHARSAVGMVALPRGIPVEIETIVEVSA